MNTIHILWAVIGITSLTLIIFNYDKPIQKITIAGILSVILLGSLFGVVMYFLLVIRYIDKYQDNIKSAFNKLNIILWERKE